jgi:hypothetical protein
MSLLAVQGGATGTGTVTLLAPVTNTNRTLTLPDVTGTVAVQGGAGVGKVLQVVNATYATQTSSSSSTYADTGLTASITPSSASNKILVLVDVAGVFKFSSDTGCSLKLLRGATDLIVFSEEAGYTGSVLTNLVGTQSCNYLDSPATTSATTYKVQFKSASNSATVRVQAISATSTITLMEIAA